MFTATSDRADGLLRESGSNDESANVTGNRGGRRVRPGPGHLRVARETETCWSVRRAWGNPQPADGSAKQPGTLRAFGHWVDLPPSGGGCHATFGCTLVHVRVTCRQRRCGEEPKELGPPQLDSAKSVPIGARTDGTGNRVSVKRCRRVRGRETGVESETRHRPPRRKARRAM